MKYGHYDINESNNTSVAKIIQKIDPFSTVVEFGSSYGYILQYLKEQKNCTVYGFELDTKASQLANANGIETKQVNLDQIDQKFFETLPPDTNYIVCADVLEHLQNIEYFIELISKYLQKKPSCRLLISFPNITYYGVISEMLKGRFEYQKVGILDDTHLHFYDRYSLEKLLNKYSLEVASLETITVDPKDSEFKVSMDQDVIKILESYQSQDYLTYQFVLDVHYTKNPKSILNSKMKNVSIIDEYENTKNIQIQDLVKKINKKDAQIIELNEAVNKKDAQIIELNEAVNKKDAQIIELNEAVNKKDAQIIELNALAQKQQDHINNLNKTIHKFKTKVNHLKIPREEIDISIVTYNSKKWIDTFFESLTNQDYPLSKLHIYITDNNSTDDTYDYLQSSHDQYAKTFSSFNVEQKPNHGFGFGHNNNFKRAKSKFILATNIDLQFEPDALTSLIKYAQDDDHTTASWEMRQKPYEHPKYYNPVTLETTWSSSACILFRKDAIDKIGGYDEHIFMYGEDVELSYRLRDNGYKLKYYPKAVCWHYTYAEAGQIKEVQYFGSTIANVLIRMRYGTKAEIKEGLKMYKDLLNAQGLIFNQRRKQLLYLLKLIYKAPFFLFRRKKNKNIHYEFLNWDYEFIRDGAFYEYTSKKQSHHPLVSVIVRTCCDRNSFLLEAIESIKNQTYTNIELIIVEDGNNNAKEIAESIQSPNISKVIYEPIPKSGRCIAGNKGLVSANGEYIIFLDDDDLFFADHLEVLVQAFKDSPTVGACYSSSFEVKTDIISKNPLNYKEKEFNIIYKEEFDRETILHHNFIPIQSILFKRELYDTYGGFDEELDNLEDWNLWTRYSYLNDFKFIDKTTSLYRVPYHPNASQERQDELDRYYKIAIEKQKKFIAQLENTTKQSI